MPNAGLEPMPRTEFKVEGGGGAAIASVGISVPANVVSSEEVGARLGVAGEWIVRRTGIRSRRIAEPGERLGAHAAPAATQALARARVDPPDGGLVGVA